jgi:hypothetical protein
MSTKKYSYPEIDSETFQEELMKKREFYYHKIPQRNVLKTKEEINDYRDRYCSFKKNIDKREWQVFLSNYISPETPYTGLLIMHGTGTGKTCTAIGIAEQFKEQVQKYNTKIYVIVPGTNIKENFKKELLYCTGETYFKNKDILDQMTKEEQDAEKRSALYGALQYYRILSYKTFHRKVLGEKITEKQLVDDMMMSSKIKKTFRRNEEGEIEREVVVDRITNMDNSLIIVDEAHNLTKNEIGEALKKVVKQSKNVKVILLSATPMKNLADDIIDMLNFIRPQDEPIARDKVFTSEKNHLMKFKPGGREYLKKMAQGYVSYFRGNMPYTFANRNEVGEIPDGLLFTPVVKCNMENFQNKYYNETVKEESDGLEKSASSAANFVYPGLDNNNNIKGYYSSFGLSKVLNQLSNPQLMKKINKEIFGGKIDKTDLANFMVESVNKNITGNILKEKYLETFSSKFYQCYKNLMKMFNDNARTAFIYSNLVNAGGIDTFAEVLKMNGLLEYKENQADYNISNDTLDSITGIPYSKFIKKYDSKTFYPATFMIITGGVDDDEIPETKQKIINDVFNCVDNINGKYLKFILGSSVMSEGVTLENVKSVHILDVHYNLGRAEQVIGRAIRFCKHQQYIKKTGNISPVVDVYKYVVSNKKGLSTDEILYQKAELKYILVKKVERVLKETAVDCPVMLHGNVFPEDLDKYKDCVEPTLENVKKGKKICPAICDFETCDYTCNIHGKYYDTKNKTYKELEQKEIDYGTFNENMYKSEIDIVKRKIKQLYKFNHVYIYSELLDKIEKSYNKHQRKMFDKYFLDKSLEDLMPRTENDYNNFKDTVYDKYKRPGYIIQRGKYYIFQPFNDNENIPLATRKTYKLDMGNNISLKSYTVDKYGEMKKTKEDKITEIKTNDDKYLFDLQYYEKRNENFIVGVIDKNSSGEDVFKVRPPIKKSDKKRGTGIVSIKGAVCNNAKDKEYLLMVANKLNKMSNKINFNKIDLSKKFKREIVCEDIKDVLMELEKYSTTKDGNKITYMMVPYNHPTLPFPYNLEDRVKYIIGQINDIVKRKFDYIVKKEDKGRKYIIEVKKDKYLLEREKDILALGFKKDTKYKMIIV